VTDASARKLILRKQAEYRKKGWPSDALARYAKKFWEVHETLRK